MPEQPHRIVVVGGGAGGLELATQLGDKLGKRGHASVTLIDKARTHIWKPKLHEIAAGNGIAVGGILLGAAQPAHIMTPSSTVRRIVNMTALAVAGAIARR